MAVREFKLLTFKMTLFFLGECRNLQDLNLSECQGLNVSNTDFIHIPITDEPGKSTIHCIFFK